MNIIQKTLSSILERDLESIDYGVADLNELYKTLSSETKRKIKKLSNKEHEKEVLKSISNKELNDLYDKLPEKHQKKLDEVSIHQKYKLLQDMLDKKSKKDSSSSKPTYGPRSPSDTPPSKTTYEPRSPSDTPPPKTTYGPRSPSPESFDKEAPAELFAEIEPPKKELPEKEMRKMPQDRFNQIVQTFYSTNPYNYSSNINHELEVKFGTKGIKPLMRNDYDNVVKKLKSSGFHIIAEENYLRINCEYLDSLSGEHRFSDIRTEVRGLYNIQEYCKTDDIKEIYKKNPTVIEFLRKRNGFINKQKVFPVDMDDFNFRVSYQTEEKPPIGITNYIMKKWKETGKEFRFINRVTFQHPDYPFKVDISIVKYSNRKPDKFGRENRGQMIRSITIDKSNVFNNPELYEIEIEVDNTQIGPRSLFYSSEIIAVSLRKVIKIVLSGLQSTNYPISYPEQKNILHSYMKLIWKDEIDTSKKHITSKHFIGPNSITLQLINIAPEDENTTQPNVRKDFVVTDKADGQRHLLFISEIGRIYLINTNMDVIFTGAKTENSDCFNSILDGELIYHNKKGTFINLYAAFDIYYIKKEDVREFPFQLLKGEEDVTKARYEKLKEFLKVLNSKSIMDIKKVTEKGKGQEDKTMTSLLKRYEKADDLISPIKIIAKEFYPNSSSQTIFDACRQILEKQQQDLFEYNTDGLIFSHAFYGVGSNAIGKAGPKTKITWEFSFKWKPPQFNTIDFLVTTVKGVNGEDMIKSIYQEGIDTETDVQYKKYKTLELRCGFNENKDGFLNPCQDIINDNLPEFLEDKKDNDYIPKRFYPTDPYDANAGLCNILLHMDGTGTEKMFSEENEVFQENTIVEFRYDLDREEGWRWVPLRVRYDKTSKLLRGEKEYGNSYNTCNENWKSIHPSGRIEPEMLCTGENIPLVNVSEDKYYNTPAGQFKTESMKNFHNLYVKKKLIVGVSNQGDTLVDFACGKAGDLPKWVNAKLSFVFGIDLSKDNLENRIDGACARFLKMRKSNKQTPYALFVNGNSGFNIKDGAAMLNDKAKQITDVVFGKTTKMIATKIGKGVERQFQKGMDGFNISSCQFALHYFFKNPDTLKAFVTNVAECTKQNGYFIGTCYDGKEVFNSLRKTKTGDSIKIIENDKKIWEIIKSYDAEVLNDDSSSIGNRIDVYQESINQTISEYLVNFEYFNRVMTNYGFELISQEEAISFGLPNGSGLFSELFGEMLDEIKKNKFKANEYGHAPSMSENERKISFLNRYFVYKKIRIVHIETVEIDLNEYNESAMMKDTRRPEEITLEEKEEEIEKEILSKKKPKIQKLSKKIVLIPATEAVEDGEGEEEEGKPVEIIEESKPSKKEKKIKEPKEKKIKQPKEKIKITKKFRIEEENPQEVIEEAKEPVIEEEKLEELIEEVKEKVIEEKKPKEKKPKEKKKIVKKFKIIDEEDEK